MHKHQIEINFEYGQTIDSRHNKSWRSLVEKQYLKRRVTQVLSLDWNFASIYFGIVSLILFICSFETTTDQGLSPVSVFVLYILPNILELLVRGVLLGYEHKQWQTRIDQATNISYHRLKRFRREDIAQGAQDLKRSQEVRSHQQLGDSQQNVGDIQVISHLEEVNYTELQVGDFLLLERKQQCPGDAVILDMSENYGLFYTRSYDSNSTLQKKFPTKTTSVEATAPNKGDLNYLRKILKGKLQLDGNIGTIKLSKDPKGESINESNMLFAGQIIQFNEWALCILISIGTETAYNKQLSPVKRPVDHKYYYFNVLQIVLYMVLPIIIVLIQSYSYYEYPSDIAKNLFQLYEQFLIIHPAYLNLILQLYHAYITFKDLYSQPLSSSKSAILESNAEKSIYRVYDHEKLRTLIKTTHVFLNIQLITDTKIDQLCIDDTIFQLDHALLPQYIKESQQLNQQFYAQNITRTNTVDYSTVNRQLPTAPPPKLTISSHIEQSAKKVPRNVSQIQFRPLGVNHSSDGAFGQQSLMGSQQSQEQDDDARQIQILKESNLIELAGAYPQKYFEVLVSLALCHLTRGELVTDDRMASLRGSKQALTERNHPERLDKFKIHQYFLAEDEAVLKLAKMFKFVYKTQGYNKKEQLTYVLRVNELELTYTVLLRLFHQGLHSDNQLSKSLKIPSRFIAIILQDDNYLIQPQMINILLVRFCIVQISDIPGYDKFDQYKKNNLQKQIQFLLNKGDLILCYIKMQLPADFEFDQGNTLVLNDQLVTHKIIDILNESTYDLLGLFGISQNDIGDFNKESFIHNRQRVIISSDRSHELLLPFCVKNNILNHESVTFNFQSTSKEDILYQIRQIITSFNPDEKKTIPSQTQIIKRSASVIMDRIRTYNNALMIDCQVLKLILDDPYLINHFGFILHFNKYIIVYNTTNEMKDQFLDFMMKYDQEYNQSLCVNYGPGSYGLQHKCDIAIQRHQDSMQDILSFNQEYSIFIDDIEQFDYLILKEYFQQFQIVDAIKQSFYTWNMTLTITAFILYVYPYSEGEIIEQSRQLISQLLFPVLIAYCCTRTIIQEQEFLEVKLNAIKWKMISPLNLEQFLNTIIDSLLILTLHAVIIADDPQRLIIDETYSIMYLVLGVLFAIQLSNQTQVYHLKVFFVLATTLLVLIFTIIELSYSDTAMLSYLYGRSATILAIILVFLLKISLQCLFQLSPFFYKDFVRKVIYEIDFTIILETLAKSQQTTSYLLNLVKILFIDYDMMDSSIRHILTKGDKNSNIVQLSSSLNFQDNNFQRQFVKIYNQKWKLLSLVSSVTYLACLDIFIIVIYSINFGFLSLTFFILMIIISIINMIVPSLNYFLFKSKIIQTALLQTCLRFLLVIYVNTEEEVFGYSVILFFILQFTIAQQINYRFEIIFAQLVIVYIVGIILFFTSNQYHDSEVALLVMMYTYCLLISLHSRYNDDLTQREDFICTKQLELENTKYQQVMSLLLPQFVLGRLDRGNVNFSENQGSVGIIFVDMCSFEKIVAEENQNIVALIDMIYRAFDQVCSSTNCQKIETVGKTYMACAGLQIVEKFQSKQQKNPIERLIELAFGVQQEISNFKWGGSKHISLKIGIHYGRVLMGVIGSIKPQFSLVGDTVNTTSRLCALCSENGVQISLAAYEQVKNSKLITFTPNKIEAKGLGILDTFFIQKKRSQEQSFVIRKKDSGNSKLDKKLKYFLDNEQRQGSFRLEKSRTISRAGPIIKQPSVPLAESSQMQQPIQQQLQQPQLQVANALLQSQFQPPAVFPSMKQVSSNFIVSQVQLRKMQTKRHLVMNPSPLIQQQQQPTQTITTSVKMAGKPSLFKNTSIQSPLVQHQNTQDQLIKMEVKGPQLDLPIDQSISLLERSIVGDTPINKKKQYDKQYNNENNKKTIKFGDQQLQVKIGVKLVNKTLPAFKIQEMFLDKKFTMNDHNQEEINLAFVINAFQSNPDVNQYYEIELQNSTLSVYKFIIALFVCNVLFIPLQSISGIQYQQIIIRCISALGSIVVVFLLKSNVFDWTRGRLVRILSMQLILQCVCMGVYYYALDYSMILSQEAIVVCYFLFSHKWLYFLEKCLIAAFILVTYLIVISSLRQIDYYQLFFVIACIILLLQRELLNYLFSFKQMLHQQQIELKQDDKMQLLSCLLPVHVLSKFLDDQQHQVQKFSDIYDDCTILFADIAGFTKYSSSVTPEEVVNMLKNLFDEFDKLTKMHNVFKLYTIGDCYVVIGVTDNLKRDPVQEAFNVVEMSLNMLEAIELVRNQINYHDLHMRIGIHTGNVIGGIIGTDIIRYDVYGKDILVANKMESSSEEGRVLISETTKKIIEDSYGVVYSYSGRKVINIPSINTTLAGYFLDIQV